MSRMLREPRAQQDSTLENDLVVRGIPRQEQSWDRNGRFEQRLTALRRTRWGGRDRMEVRYVER